jgi:quinol monooxygenase YgiN
VKDIDSKLVTICIFKVQAEREEELMAVLRNATRETVCCAPGFVSATLHRSLDRRQIALYARWDSVDAYEALRADPAPGRSFLRALEVSAFQPGPYHDLETFLPTSGGSKDSGCEQMRGEDLASGQSPEA